MKLSMLPSLIVAIFTACTFAVSDPPDTVNVTVPEFKGDYFKGAVPTVGPGLATGPIVIPDGEVYDQTNMSLAGNAGEPQQELRITMGTQLQHVGYTVSRNLASDLREVLETVCYSKELHPPTPRSCRSDKYWIKNIEYSKGSDAHLIVQVESSDYDTHNPASRDVDLLFYFINTIVDTFEAAVNCDKNRYHILDVAARRCNEFANSADWYQVGIHGMADGVFPHMRVKITFNGKTTEGQFDCKGTQTNVWGSMEPHPRASDYAKIMGFPLRAAVACANKDGVVEGLPTGECIYDKPWLLTCKLDPKCEHN